MINVGENGMRWLFGGRGEIRSINDARKRLAGAEYRADSIDAAHDVLALASEVAANVSLSIPEKLDLILFIEGEARRIFDKLIHGYLMKARLSAPGGVVYEFLQAYVRGASRMYVELAPLCSGGRMRGSAGLALARAMDLLGVGKRLTMLRRAPLSEDVVRVVMRIWKEAHGAGIESDRFKLYDWAHESSVKSLMLRSLLIEVSGPENLSPAQIEAADEVLRRFENQFEITRDASCVFWMDLEGGGSPRRMRDSDSGSSAGIRFGPGSDFEERIGALMEHLRSGKIPRSMHFDVDVNRGDLLAVMKHLQHNLGVEPPSRKHDRVGVSRPIEVVGTADGVAQVLIALEKQETRIDQDLHYQEMLEIRMYGQLREQTRAAIEEKKRAAAKLSRGPSLQGEIATWEAENVSEGGLGAVAPSMGSWIKIGTLVGFRMSEDDDFELGVIRRIRPASEGGKIHVGVQIIFADAMMPAWIYHATVAGGSDGDFRTPCLLVSSGDRQCVLMRPGYYVKDKRVRLAAGRNEAVVRFGVSLERTHDFEMMSVVEERA